MAPALFIIVVEKDRDRALLIVDSLRAAGDHDIHVIEATAKCLPTAPSAFSDAPGKSAPAPRNA